MTYVSFFSDFFFSRRGEGEGAPVHVRSLVPVRARIACVRARVCVFVSAHMCVQRACLSVCMCVCA